MFEYLEDRSFLLVNVQYMANERLSVPLQHSPWEKGGNHFRFSNGLRDKFPTSPPRVVRGDVEKSSESDFIFHQSFQVDLVRLP